MVPRFSPVTAAGLAVVGSLLTLRRASCQFYRLQDKYTVMGYITDGIIPRSVEKEAVASSTKPVGGSLFAAPAPAAADVSKGKAD